MITCIHTVLSRASARGPSQLKRQKLGAGGYAEKKLNYFRARAHPGCEVSCQGVPNRPLALSLHPCFIEASPTVEKAVSATTHDLGYKVILTIAVRFFDLECSFIGSAQDCHTTPGVLRGNEPGNEGLTRYVKHALGKLLATSGHV